jgi:hypothetical protein
MLGHLSETVPVTTTEPLDFHPWLFHHVWPVAVVLFAAVVNVVWIAVLGYAIRLVL